MTNRRFCALTALILAAAMIFGACAAQAASPDLVSKANLVKTLTMSRTRVTIDLGRYYDLSVTSNPTRASNRTAITWDWSPKGSLVVEPNATDPRKARVRVIAADYPAETVLITAKSTSGRPAYCTVTIKKVGVTSVNVTPAKKTVYLTSPRPDPFKLTATVSPGVAGEQGVTWSTVPAGEAVAKVDPDTGEITVKGEGSVRIYATAKDGSLKKDYTQLTVYPVRVKSFSLSVDSADKSPYMDIGDKLTIKPNILPVNASWQGVKWTSDKTSVAEVDEFGVVTAKASGVVTISAETDIGKYVKRASIQLFVRSASPTKVAITALGDVILGGDPRTYRGAPTARSSLKRYNQYMAANADMGDNKYAFPFRYIKNIFYDSAVGGVTNLGFMNLEGTLTSKSLGNYRTTRSFVFKGEPEYAKAVVYDGKLLIDAISVANNHSSDFGAYSQTLKNIRTYGGGALPVGEGLNASFNAEGKKVEFIAVVSKGVSASRLAKRIQNAKNGGAALVVVSVHWTNMASGKRGVYSPMQSYARAAIRAGADLVLGHHRHEVSGIEKYRGKYIVYDLGNSAAGSEVRECYAFQVIMEMHEGFNEVRDQEGAVRIYPMWSSHFEEGYAIGKKLGNGDWQSTPVARGSDKWNVILSNINKYSPVGEDGTRFTAGNFLTDYPGGTD